MELQAVKVNQIHHFDGVIRGGAVSTESAYRRISKRIRVLVGGCVIFGQEIKIKSTNYIIISAQILTLAYHYPYTGIRLRTGIDHDFQVVSVA